MPYLSLRPSQVLLDPQNPRLPDGTSNDREAINRLLDEGSDSLINLARDMAQSGQTNPAELPIALRDGSKYLILEGNRRFAALKLLKDPRLANSEPHQQAFRRAAGLGLPPKSVYTLIVSSREEADRWIVLRHTGENSGRGTKRWSASQAATYRSRSNKSIDSGTMRSMVFEDALLSAYADDEEIPGLLRDIRVAKFTNIGRFFSPDVHSPLGLRIHSEKVNGARIRVLLSEFTPEQMRQFFTAALKVIKNKSVDAYKNPDRREEILQSLVGVRPEPASALPEMVPFADGASVADGEDDPGQDDSESDDDNHDNAGAYEDSGDDSTNPATSNGSPSAQFQPEQTTVASASSNTTTSTPTHKPAREAKPERFLLQGLKLPNHNARIQHLLKEVRALEIAVCPGVCCVMMRVIVELSVSSSEVLALSGCKESDALKKKIIRILTYLDPDIEVPIRRDKELDQAYLEASDIGFQYLNSFIHNPSVRPDEQLARRFSSAFRPLLERVDTAIK